MTSKLSPRYVSALALVALLVAFLLPMQSALAGGCCFRSIAITSLGTGRQAIISGPALTTPYDLSTFWSFTNFSQRVSKPSRSGLAYEVARDGWDHLIYYPSVGDQPGVVYYEGLFGGSSEYDHQWFAVPPEQDAALRQVLASQGFSSGATPQTPALIVTGILVAGLLLTLASVWAFSWHHARRRAQAWAVTPKTTGDYG